VRFGGEEGVALLVDRRCGDPAERLVVEVGDAGVDLVRFQLHADLQRGERADLQVDARVAAQQRLGDPLDGGQRGRDHPQAQAAAELTGEPCRFARETLDAGQRLLGPDQQALALRRQVVVALAALDQLDAELALELADRDRERRLGDVAGLRRAPEVPLARERVQVLELAQEHARHYPPRRPPRRS
jgi:hypothetical protein